MSRSLPTRIPSPREPVPAVALPALGVFVGSLALWTASSTLGLSGTWPLDEPELTTAFGRPLTDDERARLRELAARH